MKKEIEVYVDTFKDKKGNINCNVLLKGQCRMYRNSSIDKYAENIKNLIYNPLTDKNEEFIIYVDCRGIGIAMYELLKTKIKNVNKLELPIVIPATLVKNVNNDIENFKDMINSIWDENKNITINIHSDKNIDTNELIEEIKRKSGGQVFTK